MNSPFIFIEWFIVGLLKLIGIHKKDFNMRFFNLSQGVDMTMKFG